MLRKDLSLSYTQKGIASVFRIGLGFYCLGAFQWIWIYYSEAAEGRHREWKEKLSTRIVQLMSESKRVNIKTVSWN